jgi:hypothetical protein
MILILRVQAALEQIRDMLQEYEAEDLRHKMETITREILGGIK